MAGWAWPEMSPWRRRGLTIPPNSRQAWIHLAAWECWMGLLVYGAMRTGTHLIVTAPQSIVTIYDFTNCYVAPRGTQRSRRKRCGSSNYDLVAALSEIYQMQELFRGNMDKVGVSSTDWFDPAAREATVRKLYMAMVELQYDERQLLLPLYRKYLPLIATAIGNR